MDEAGNESKTQSETESHPSITYSSFQAALKTLVSQHKFKHSSNQYIPEAVFLDKMPSYDEFFRKFLVPNQLCVISEKATRTWSSRREWVCQNGTPNFDFLLQTFGQASVPVADCQHKEVSAHAKQDMKMSEFVQYWRRLVEASYPKGVERLYLKDWHFTRAFPGYKAYSTCQFFCSDWMNEFWDVRDDSDDDYRFVYMGPKGTWTPFHADVFRSFSWSANICGRKKWILYPPGEEEFLKDIHDTLVYDVTSRDLQDKKKFPNAGKVQHKIEIIQHPGETIFVPSGWHHQVENLDDTISINHNWLNGSNVQQCWNHLKATLADVQREISDCKDMEGWDQQCQKILKAFSGIDYSEFFSFMRTIAVNRIRALHDWGNQQACQSNLHEELHKGSNYHDSEWKEKREISKKAACGNECAKLVEETTLQEDNHVHAGDKPPSQMDERVSAITDSIFSTVLNLCSDRQRNSGQAHRNVKEASACSNLPSACGSPSSWPGLAEKDCHLMPHWSQCNVYHALYDLVSLSLVIKDMSRAPEMTVLQELERTQSSDGELDSGFRTGGDSIKANSDSDQSKAKSDCNLNCGGENKKNDFELDMCTKDATASRVPLHSEDSFASLDLNKIDCRCRVCLDQISTITSCEDLLIDISHTLCQFGVEENIDA